MRLKNLRELIHTHPTEGRCQSATVSVEFVQREEDREYTFEISRSVSINDESTYMIDGRKSTHDEVVRLLKQKGIDLVHNRFMILQGEVELISLMKPKGTREHQGFLEYLEEIIGSSAYVDQIEEYELKFDRLNLSRIEHLEYLRIAEENVASLRGGKAQAIKYLACEERCFQLQSLLGQQRASEARRSAVIASEEAVRKRAIEKEIREKLALLESKHRPQFEELSRKKQASEKLNEAVNVSNEELERINGLFEAEKLKFRAVATRVVEAEQEKERNQKKLARFINEKNQAEQVLPDLQDQLSAAEAKETALRKQVAEAEKALAGRCAPLFAERNEAESRLFAAQAAAKLDSDAQAAQRRLAAQAEREAEALAERTGAASTALGRARAEAMNAKGQVEGSRRAVEACAGVCATLAGRVESLSDSKAAAEAEYSARLRAQANLRQGVAEKSQKSKVFTRLFRACAVDKKLTGLLGRSGDGVMVDPRLDLAVSAAGQAHWNKVIAVTLDAAKAAVDFLKVEKIGTASFLALDKQAALKQKMGMEFEAPAGSVRLFDLLRFKNDATKLAAFFAVQDTLLVADLPTARKIAFSGQTRYRVVTLKGELIEKSGAMTGGGEPLRGLTQLGSAGPQASDFPSLVKALLAAPAPRPEEFSRAETHDDPQLEASLAAEVEALRSKLVALKSELEEAANKLAAARKEESVLSERLNKESRLLAEADAKESSLAEACRKFEAEQKQKTSSHISDLANLQAKAEKSAQKVLEANQKLTEVQQKIAKEGGAALTKKMEEKKQAEAVKTELQEKVSAEKARAANAARTIEELKSEQEQLAVKSDKLELEKKPIQIRTDELVSIAEKVMEECAKKKSQLIALKAEIAEILKSGETARRESELLKKEAEEKMREAAEAESNQRDQLTLAAAAEKEVRKIAVEYAEIWREYPFQGTLAELKSLGEEEKQKNKNDDGTESAKKRDIDEERLESSPAPNTIDWSPVFSVKVGDAFPESVLTSFAEPAVKLRLDHENSVRKSHNSHLDALARFQSAWIEYLSKQSVFQNSKNEADQVRASLEALRAKRKSEFFAGFDIISQKLAETYEQLTGGGSAELELLDPNDPFSQGILFSVRPPGKSWKQMLKLSGGEKTLSSLSLIFALHYFKPNPVYFMDEIDAALDFKNVEVVARFIQKKTQGAQFLVISLRNAMFESANKLFGVYKTDHASHIVSLDPENLMKMISE